MSVIPRMMVRNSAKGMVAHTPLIPRIWGKRMIPRIINNSPLLAAMITEFRASPINVKYPDVMILNPFIKKAIAYIFVP